MAEKCCGVRAVIRESKYRAGEIEIVYKDPRYEVYSYELGDGIWGTSIDCLENDAIDDFIKTYGSDTLRKVNKGEEVPVCVPIGDINKKYSLLEKKTGKPVLVSERDLGHMCFEGVITLPDGRQVEPDAPDSPLREMGMI